MEGDAFAHMRPYRDHEVPAAIDLLKAAVDWQMVLQPFMGKGEAVALLDRMSGIATVTAFQDLISKPVIEALLTSSTDVVTYSLPDDFNPDGALFISNHRDIVLDPSLINLALVEFGSSTTEIGIGSNLLGLPWVEALVRLNRSFIVKRGGTPREQLANSAEVAAYVREVVMQERRSVWLAQREGRAKDGDDRTSPALIRMLLDGGGAEHWEGLRVHPVALSYEWDPCDGMKVRELLMREANGGQYEKSPGEDERSMKMGLFGWKGRVHVGVGTPEPWVEAEGRPHQVLAEATDRIIFTNMKLWPNQLWAAEQIAPGSTEGLDMRGESAAETCEARLEEVIAFVQQGQPFSAEAIRMKWCEINAQPVFNWLEVNAPEGAQKA